MLRKLLPLLMMLFGALLGEWLEPLSPIIPWLISAMLFLTILGVCPEALRLRASHGWLLLVQSVLVALGYVLALPLGQTLAAAVLLCLITPAATAGPVVVRLLGGDAGFTTTYVLLSHLVIVLVAPIVLPWASGEAVAMSLGDFLAEAYRILYRVSVLILPALGLGWLMRRYMPRQADWLSAHAGLSMFCWLLSLLLLMGHTVQMLDEWEEGVSTSLMVSMGVVGLLSCLLQMGLGMWLAPRLGLEVSAVRHALGQKNTTLAIWLGALFLSPVVALASAAYIIWQNIAITYFMSRPTSRAGSTPTK